MDVRCDRCQTEYELDDDSVGDSGAAVQCTSCGHTFTVMRPQPGTTQARVTPPAQQASEAVAAAPGPTLAEWLLQTADGQFHRFRELTTLQKWIIERKVTRDDRISRTGQAWRPLGEIVELSSFFDVVDEADRARAAVALQSQMGTSDTRRRTGNQAIRQTGSRPAAPSLDSPIDDGMAAGAGGEDATPPPARPSRSMAGAGGGRAGASEIVDERVLYSRSGETSELSTLEGGGRTKKVVAMLGFLGAAGVVAYLGIRSAGSGVLGFSSAPPAAPPALTPPAPSPSSVASPDPLATAPAVPTTPPAVVEAPSAAPATPAAPSPEPTSEAEPSSGGGGSSSGGSYARLVSDADRLLENGKPGRAQKLYEKALGVRPSGAEALTGLAYVMLDQQKRSTAIAMFKQALGAAGSHGPALFGLAEAYRSSGERELALEHYRKYLAVEPGGHDAPAARRQVKDLEAAERRAAPPPEPPADPKPPAKPEEVAPGLVDPMK